VIEVPASSVAAMAWQAVSDRFWLADQLAAPLLAVVLLASGWGARLCAAISRGVGAGRFRVVAGYAACFAVLLQLVRAPLDFLWARAYARATEAPPLALGAWLPGQALEALLVAAAFVGVAVALYGLLGRSPRTGWLQAAIAASAIVLAGLAAQPWTRSYEPLGHSPIDGKIAAMASRAGVPVERIGIQHSGDASGCGAATVIGLGPTRLMLLDDTLVRNYSADEIVESVAHESSHFTRDDNVKAFAMISAWLLCALALAQYAGQWAASRWQRRFGFAELSDPASLPLLVAIVAAAYLVALPFGRAYQRDGVEQRADRFALDLTHDNHSEAMLYVKDMKCYPLLVASPGAFYQAFRATHPSIAQRIRFANGYHPWQR
jgi:Zn-dependent protease with chaperone function